MYSRSNASYSSAKPHEHTLLMKYSGCSVQVMDMVAKLRLKDIRLFYGYIFVVT